MPKYFPKKVRLLFGPYRAPKLRRGRRATCLLRGDVIITGTSDGRIPWPRCRRIGARGGSGLLLAGELVEAVRRESAAAVCFWWGVSEGVVWRWRRELGVGRMDSEGSARLFLDAAAKGAAAMMFREWTEAERQERREQALALDLGRHLQPGYHGPRWTRAQLDLLGTLPDAEVAEQLGRTENAVRVMRTRRKIATARDRRRKEAEAAQAGRGVAQPPPRPAHATARGPHETG